MDPKSLERKHNSSRGDCYPTQSPLPMSDSREPPVTSGGLTDPRSRTIEGKSAGGGGFDGHRQSETVSEDLEDRLDPTNSTGQSISNKDKMETDSTGTSFPYNPCDGSREAGVSENDILRGERILRGEKPFVCVVCEKAFPNKSQLKRHGFIHTGEKAFTCTQCGKLFARKINLKLHLLSHSKSKLFCYFCYKPFSVPRSLDRHILNVHLEVISFACEICRKAFPSVLDVQLHKRVHIGKDPYECKVCNRKYYILYK